MSVIVLLPEVLARYVVAMVVVVVDLLGFGEVEGTCVAGRMVDKTAEAFTTLTLTLEFQSTMSSLLLESWSVITVGWSGSARRIHQGS